ncbi:sulfurtransferase [Alkalihalophilus lindianensis]|uniref:thiosulfate sulfurtransferase n=1 Tax=Alkalihalophilus lindianensis TaxID=1630542 RepID=A0ABU3XGQ9_9BACI|nr:sulfurtransferase [Alkalihalophilus lindianensis]MDV2686594.1 sulfurtransferase [Alkalihalophilus lindianensis]
MRTFLFFMIVCFMLSTSLMMEGSAREMTYPNQHLLISVEELAGRLSDPTLRIIDTRNDGYEEGHIYGAVSFDTRTLVDSTHPIEGYLIREQPFEELMKELGVRNEDELVIYDDGLDTAATRLFYALELYGHNNVRVLNGGYTAWTAAGGAQSTTAPEVKTSDFKAKTSPYIEVEKEYVKSAIDNPNKVILDVRSRAEYKGEDVRAKRGGHIPTAVNIEWKEVLKDGVPFFKMSDDIERMLLQAGVTKDKQVIIYCQKANRASHMYFTLRLMGFDHLRMYEGSWQEWGNDPHTPITNLSEE